jgi:hypothetical protein
MAIRWIQRSISPNWHLTFLFKKSNLYFDNKYLFNGNDKYGFV